MTPTVTAIEFMPVLSRGRHRAPHRGACFMEMATLLAGERWSDHPTFTHPLLAELARLVNDTLTDRKRPRLMPLIPSVIGLTSDDLRMDATITLDGAVTALPLATKHRVHILVTGVLASERVLAVLDGRDPVSLSERSRDALATIPQAEAWAVSFSSGHGAPVQTFREQIARHVLNIAVQSIASPGVPDFEQRLIDLLADTIADCEKLVANRATPIRSTSTTGQVANSPACL
jgi:hypothetical protein